MMQATISKAPVPEADWRIENAQDIGSSCRDQFQSWGKRAFH